MGWQMSICTAEIAVCEGSLFMDLFLAPDSIDLTVTSPPYDNLRKYNGFEFDFEAIAKGLWRVTKPGGLLFG